MNQLTPLKKALRELAEVGEEEHEGHLIDLVTVLSKIVKDFERKGNHYMLKKYAPELIARPIQDSEIDLARLFGP